MKVLFEPEVYEENPCNDFSWYWDFKFNGGKRKYGIDNPIDFKRLCNDLFDLVDRLEEEESIEEIILFIERSYYDDEGEIRDFFNFVICRDDYEIDTDGYEVLEADNYSDLIELIEQKMLEASGAESIK